MRTSSGPSAGELWLCVRTGRKKPVNRTARLWHSRCSDLEGEGTAHSQEADHDSRSQSLLQITLGAIAGTWLIAGCGTPAPVQPPPTAPATSAAPVTSPVSINASMVSIVDQAEWESSRNTPRNSRRQVPGQRTRYRYPGSDLGRDARLAEVVARDVRGWLL